MVFAENTAKCGCGLLLSGDSSDSWDRRTEDYASSLVPANRIQRNGQSRTIWERPRRKASWVKPYRQSEAQAELIQGQQQRIEARQSRLSHLESMIDEQHTASSQVAGLTTNPRRVEGIKGEE